MQPVLAIDCSGPLASVALGLRDHSLLQTQNEGVRQARDLLAMIQTLLDQSNLARDQLESVIWASGPGSFTGVRIATAIAQGLGYALGCALYPVSSLELLAKSLADQLQPGETLLVVEDAHMGECYWARFTRTAAGITRQTDDCLSVAADIPHEGVVYCAGSGMALLTPDSTQAMQTLSVPDALATWLLPTRKEDLASLAAVDPFQAEPAYLRNESAWKTLDRQ